jgi:divalent metal cation (Fe/Co/Zn/Cd) transporter
MTEARPETATPPADQRMEVIGRALRLEYLTVTWSIIEAGVGIAAALASGSVALLGFGLDSLVEGASGGVLIWRLLAERRAVDEEAIEHLDRTAHRLVGGSLFLLATYVAGDAVWTLWRQERPHPSLVGIALTSIALVVMWWLGRAKRRAAASLASRALAADAFQATACFWLSLIALVSIALNAGFGWWWADPIGALVMTVFVVKEGREAWRGEDHCAEC